MIKGSKPLKELPYGDFVLLHARDLQKFVSSEINSNEFLRFDKIVIIKEDDLTNLRTRIMELLKVRMSQKKY